MPYHRIIAFVLIAFGGYVVGARAGRTRYRHLKRSARTLWGSSAGRLARTTARRGGRRLSRAITH